MVDCGVPGGREASEDRQRGEHHGAAVEGGERHGAEAGRASRIEPITVEGMKKRAQVGSTITVVMTVPATHRTRLVQSSRSSRSPRPVRRLAGQSRSRRQTAWPPLPAHRREARHQRHAQQIEEGCVGEAACGRAAEERRAEQADRARDGETEMVHQLRRRGQGDGQDDAPGSRHYAPRRRAGRGRARGRPRWRRPARPAGATRAPC